MIRRPPRSTQSRSSAASDVYKRQSAPAYELPTWDASAPIQGCTGGADRWVGTLVGLLDVLRGQRAPRRADLDRIFGIGSAAVTLEVSMGLRTTDRAEADPGATG